MSLSNCAAGAMWFTYYLCQLELVNANSRFIHLYRSNGSSIVIIIIVIVIKMYW